MEESEIERENREKERLSQTLYAKGESSTAIRSILLARTANASAILGRAVFSSGLVSMKCISRRASLAIASSIPWFSKRLLAHSMAMFSQF